MKTRLLSIAAIGLLALAACGDDESGNNGTANNQTTNNGTTNNQTTNNGTTNNGTTNNQPAVSAVTYNAGLAVGFVSLAAERQQPVADALSGLEDDYVCLQEVWLTQDGDGNWTQDNIDAVLSATSDAYPHSYHEITNTTASGSCTEDESGPLVTCVEANCAEVPPGELSGCVLGQCGDEYGALSDGCKGCLLGELGNTFEDIQAACIGTEGGNSYFSDGHNGLLLLSKHPLTDTSETTMPAVQVSRSILKASSEHPDFGAVDIYCTHLTAAIGGVDYPADSSEFASYEEEQANQIDTLLGMVEMSTNPAIVLGDMNTGPAIGEIGAELPANWTTFAESGLYFPHIDESAPFCTYCSTNTLVDSTDDVLIDHVMTTWEPTVLEAERIFDETADIGGAQNNLSDHYGVRVRVSGAAE